MLVSAHPNCCSTCIPKTKNVNISPLHMFFGGLTTPPMPMSSTPLLQQDPGMWRSTPPFPGLFNRPSQLMCESGWTWSLHMLTIAKGISLKGMHGATWGCGIVNPKKTYTKRQPICKKKHTRCVNTPYIV